MLTKNRYLAVFCFFWNKIAVAIQERWNNRSTLFLGCDILIISNYVND